MVSFSPHLIYPTVRFTLLTNHSVLLESHLALGLSLLVLLPFWQFPSQLPLLALHPACPVAVKNSPELCLSILFSLYTLSLGWTHPFPWLQLPPVLGEIIRPKCPDNIFSGHLCWDVPQVSPTHVFVFQEISLAFFLKPKPLYLVTKTRKLKVIVDCSFILILHI